MTQPPDHCTAGDRALLLRRAWWAVGWFGVGLVIWLSLMHNPPRLEMALGDKVQHAAAYAVLMLWFMQLLPLLRQRACAAIALVALGIAIEFVQGATDYREFSYGDMLADAFGVAVGWLLAPPRLPNLLDFAARNIANLGSDP